MIGRVVEKNERRMFRSRGEEGHKRMADWSRRHAHAKLFVGVEYSFHLSHSSDELGLPLTSKINGSNLYLFLRGPFHHHHLV